MLDEACLFCKIIQGTIKSTRIYENDHVIVIQDIHPKAPIHYLIIPKHHTKNISTLTDQDQAYGWAMLTAAQHLGQMSSITAYNLIINNGTQAGQSIAHLHMHFLSGRNLYSGGLSL